MTSDRRVPAGLVLPFSILISEQTCFTTFAPSCVLKKTQASFGAQRGGVIYQNRYTEYIDTFLMFNFVFSGCISSVDFSCHEHPLSYHTSIVLIQNCDVLYYIQLVSIGVSF